MLVNIVLQKWEYKPTLRAEIPLVRIGVVLGGMLNQKQLPEEQVHFSESSERILEALLLEQQGIIREIIISGGSGSVTDQSKKESKRLYDFIHELDNRPPKIILDTISRNTFENALYTAQILAAKGFDEEPFLLITSAFHMQRSLLCFKKQGLNPVPYAVDFKNTPFDVNPSWLIPSAASLAYWDLLIKEWIGIGTYKLFGYI